jgi:2,3,4,5-tetrahydropyridine-2-carboxylate N-succinyltransferase
VFGTPCVLVIGERTESTDRKTSLERAIRDYGVSV